MVAIAQVPVTWTGFVGGPGVSTFFMESATPNVAAIRAYFNAAVAGLPDDVTISFPTSGSMFDMATGELLGTTWSAGTVSNVVGTSTGAYAAAVGSSTRWNTPTVINNRRLTGRTFLVPLASSCYNGIGQLDTSFVNAISTAAATFLTATSGEFVVWHRPVAGSGGLSVEPSSATVPSKVSILRSRRD